MIANLPQRGECSSYTCEETKHPLIIELYRSRFRLDCANHRLDPTRRIELRYAPYPDPTASSTRQILVHAQDLPHPPGLHMHGGLVLLLLDGVLLLPGILWTVRT